MHFVRLRLDETTGLKAESESKTLTLCVRLISGQKMLARTTCNFDLHISGGCSMLSRFLPLCIDISVLTARGEENEG